MTTWDRLQAEAEALQSLMALHVQAKETRAVYEKWRLPLPKPLVRFLEVDQVEKTDATPRNSIPPPSLERPSGIDPDWLAVPARECSPTTLIPAVLAASPEPMVGNAVLGRVSKLNAKLLGGSIYNAANRLRTRKVIETPRTGWFLISKDNVAHIAGDVLWGPETAFLKEEMAFHRREAIIHILSHFETGLELVQLVEQLRNCSWVKAPVNKDLLKADVEVMEAERKIRRRGNTRKWELVPPEKGDTNSKTE